MRSNKLGHCGHWNCYCGLNCYCLPHGKKVLSFSLGAYKIDCFMLCTGLCWDSFHNLVWVFGDRVDAEITPSCHSHQPWSHLMCKRLLILVLSSSNIGVGCLGLVELKPLFPSVSSTGFVLHLGPKSTRGPPTTPEICELRLGGVLRPAEQMEC